MAASLEEKDLFGDEEDEADLFGDEDPPAASPPPSGSAPVQSESAAPRTSEEDLIEEEDLFGSEDEAQEDAAGVGEEDVEEKDLFGSDDEEGPAPSQAAAVQSPASQPTSGAKAASEADLSEMDERDIFGDISDDELPEKVEDVIVRNRPKPDNLKRDFVTVRLPNILNFDKTPFKPYTEKSISDTLKVGFSEMENTMDREVIKLLNPENVIRWRFQREADGSIKQAMNGQPMYQSNARLVEWEDGSKTLHVGKEPFNATEVPDKALLYEENSRDIHVCHGEINSRLVTTPNGLTSDTHAMLKIAQFRKYIPKRRAVIITLDEGIAALEAGKKHAELQMSAAKKPRLEGDQALTAAWLEDDEPLRGEGESVKDIKKSTLRDRIAG